MCGSSEDLKKRDTEKKYACKAANVTLIDVPYWWNMSKQSLATTIRSYRPDLLQIIPEINIQPIHTKSLQ